MGSFEIEPRRTLANVPRCVHHSDSHQRPCRSDHAFGFSVCGRDRVSKYEFGQVLAAHFGYDPKEITPISVKELPLIAPRPSDMSLNAAKAERFLGRNMPSIVESVNRLAELEKQGWPQLLAAAVAANVDK
ncbi:MAG: hypothetical protein DMG13_00935 [Acidobacteria bacterium]|nr:MAG: hypothetical protein DMG13_00935 [Acidobacteriota bacterium]